MKKPFIAAQGDVLIIQISNLPTTVVSVETNGVATLAHGEATGHHHSIFSDRVALFREDGSGSGLFMVASGPVSLVHQEHAPIDIPAGKYKVLKQRVMSAGLARRVAD